MSVSFLIDANLPEALARFLAAKGLRSVHVSDLGLRSEDDTVIWQLAADSGRAIVSKDVDFANLAGRPSSGSGWATRRESRCWPASSEISTILSHC